MIEALNTDAEFRAASAATLQAFDGINLLGIKRSVEVILGLIGRDGIFDEYTLHNITHIDAMLKSLDWIIPDETKTVMTPADWLLIVLSIYFHDLGMLVTRDEFSKRDRPSFREYCRTKLFADEMGVDYRSKIDELSGEDKDRFLYQEFVRHSHAERIREWIVGSPTDRLGCAHAAMSETASLLERLGSQFRRDLGLVCESHYLDDLNDTAKYKLSQPYGNSDAETANLQFVAILLRTADLLHITQDRVPSVAFRLISPTDPISQREWAKQRAVTRIRPQLGKDKEGRPSDHAIKDTIEVFAFFTKPDGFFGLTSYLSYVKGQLQKSNNWVSHSRDTLGSKYEFPWRYIDDSHLETEGFLRDSFEFTLDQARILDLLTGHTLYNETSVVLRELVQNSLDAIRLQREIDSVNGNACSDGQVHIKWDSVQRVLTVEDNGTGMTQSTIVQHLLRVGASKYQDPDFRKEFPAFSSISRFGIGVLSTFMVADNVEILTCHPDEDKARLLNLRSVHGKYLVRLLDKQDDLVPPAVKQHGTLVRVKRRTSAELPDIVETARRWIVIPACDVDLTVDGQEPISIGYSSPKEVLIDLLETSEYAIVEDGHEPIVTPGIYRSKARVRQVEVGNVTIAFALEWYESFREWGFLSISRAHIQRDRSYVGTCIEGVRVEFESPGFQQTGGVVAIVNARGPNAPKTNVARSGLERTREYDELLKTIYRAYCDHVRGELNDLQSERAYSLTWAVQEARYLASPLYSGPATSAELLLEHIFDLPLILAERDDHRCALSVHDLQSLPYFWTVDSQFFRSAERMIREVSSSASLRSIIKAAIAQDFRTAAGRLFTPLLPGRDRLRIGWGICSRASDGDVRYCKTFRCT